MPLPKVSMQKLKPLDLLKEGLGISISSFIDCPKFMHKITDPTTFQFDPFFW